MFVPTLLPLTEFLPNKKGIKMKHVLISDSLHSKLVERKKAEGPALHRLAEKFIKLGMAAESAPKLHVATCKRRGTK
jgi:hypothetical protein